MNMNIAIHVNYNYFVMMTASLMSRCNFENAQISARETLLAGDDMYHILVCRKHWFNSLRPSDAYKRLETGPSLVQIMACELSLFCAKPLSEPMLEYC